MTFKFHGVPQIVALTVLILVSPVETAQQPPEGQLKTKVLDALKSVTAGTCPETLMTPLLLDACEQQLERMRAHLIKLGSLKEARYRGLEPMPNGVQAEVYRVIFERGMMTWMAAAGPNGKLNVFWSPG